MKWKILLIINSWEDNLFNMILLLLLGFAPPDILNHCYHKYFYKGFQLWFSYVCGYASVLVL